MGEDLFWAIRGGGGESFRIFVAWKLNLVSVPATVTSFSVIWTLEQNSSELVHRWQYIGHELPDEVYMFVGLNNINSTQEGTKTILATFRSMFLGTIDKLLPIMQQRFPDLGLSRHDCLEMSWVEAHLYFNGIQNQPLKVLINRTYMSDAATPYSKIKSDYVMEPTFETGLNGLFLRLYEEEVASSVIILFAYGGIMDRIPENATQFPHRSGNLYKVFYLVGWQEEDNINSQRYLGWARSTYNYMTPFVSKCPREAYVNYRDLDIGTNNQGYTNYAQANVWGRKYFKNNFDKLVYVKTMIDPSNFFRHEQSIPPRR